MCGKSDYIKHTDYKHIIEIFGIPSISTHYKHNYSILSLV